MIYIYIIYNTSYKLHSILSPNNWKNPPSKSPVPHAMEGTFHGTIVVQGGKAAPQDARRHTMCCYLC